MAATRDFGLTLALAHLTPDFVAQFYDSGLVEDTDGVLFAQMDDLRGWLRAGGRQESELASEVAELLLEGEAEASAAAALDGGVEALALQLGALADKEEEEGVDSHLVDPPSLRPLLQLVVEEADSLQRWSLRETGVDFSASLSFSLPQPAKNPFFSKNDLELGLKRHGGEHLIPRLTGSRVNEDALSGVINVDLYGGGDPPGAPYPDRTSVTRVAIADSRAGDQTRLALSFHYPKAWEAYFALVLEAARKRLNLK